jgi:hypothetical protein
VVFSEGKLIEVLSVRKSIVVKVLYITIIEGNRNKQPNKRPNKRPKEQKTKEKTKGTTNLGSWFFGVFSLWVYSLFVFWCFFLLFIFYSFSPSFF